MSDSPDRSQDDITQDAITTIAEEMHYPRGVVERVYEVEFARLKADARITDYLHLFAARRTRHALQSRHP